MNKLLSYIIRLVVWLSGFTKFFSRLGFCDYDAYSEGKQLKVLLVGYNGARNTGADARVVALTQQLQQQFGTDRVIFTLLTLSQENLKGYFSKQVRLFQLNTTFFFSLLRAASTHHVAVLCEGSTLTRTFADALCMFYCEAAGIMQRQGKPCIAYGSEVGQVDGWLARLSRAMMRDTYYIVRTEESLKNLNTLGFRGHVGTDTAWTFQTPEGEQWAVRQLHDAGWDGRQPLLGVAVVNPFCWPVIPSLWRWTKSVITGDHSQQYNKLFFFSDSEERRAKFKHYITEIAKAVRDYQQSHNSFVVILGMEQLDAAACEQLERLIEGKHAVFTSRTCDVFQMTGLLRQLSMLITSRYHAAVLSMERTIPMVAISMDNRLASIMHETELADHYLFSVDEEQLGQHVTAALQHADNHRQEISGTISRHLVDYKTKVNDMTTFFNQWLSGHFS